MGWPYPPFPTEEGMCLIAGRVGFSLRPYVAGAGWTRYQMGKQAEAYATNVRAAHSTRRQSMTVVANKGKEKNPLPTREGAGGWIHPRYFFSVQWPTFHASDEKGEYSTLMRSGR